MRSLYFSRVLDGISGGNISIATAYIADITTPENRAKGMGLIGAAFGIGFVFGPAIGGIVGKHLGARMGRHRLPPASPQPPSSLTITTLAESHHPGDPDPEGLRRYNAATIFHVLVRPVVGMLILMAFVNGFAFAGMEQTFSLLLQQRAHLSATGAAGAAGYLFCGIGVVIAIIQGGLIGRLTKSLGEAPLVIAGPGASSPSACSSSAPPACSFPIWTGFIIGSFFLSVGSSIFNPSIQSIVSRHAGTKEQGEVLGAFQGMASLARALGPLLAGALYACLWTNSPYYGSPPYYLSAILCLIVTFWAIAMRRKLTPPASPA